MMRTRGAIFFLAIAAMLVAAQAAAALEQTSGVGQTHESATLGFTAKSDNSGELTYAVDDGTFWVHCKRFSSYERTESPKGYPKVTITARKCFRKNGAQRFLRAVFIDRGEPGIAWDIARILWSRTWPATPETATRKDRGRITAGNIQILQDTASS